MPKRRARSAPLGDGANARLAAALAAVPDDQRAAVFEAGAASAAEREPPELYMCPVCYDNPMIDPVMMHCCGQCVCRHCYVRHLEANISNSPSMRDQRCPCCGTAAGIEASVERNMPVVCIPLRAAIEHEYADALRRRLASLPARDKAGRLEKRFKKYVRKRDAAHHEECMRLMAEIGDD